MSKLAFYTQFNLHKPYRVSDDVDCLSDALAEAGILYQHWSCLSVLPNCVISELDMLDLFSEQIEQVKSNYGYNEADVAIMKPGDAFAVSVRGRYLSEHTHEEDEARFFIAGKTLMYIHANQKVHILECNRGDFVIIPKGIKHWMDIGPKPDFSVIRWFNSKRAFVNQFTDGFVAEATPRWETIYGEAHFQR